MGNRPLAYIEKILSISEIPGADRVEMAQVLDFHVVVQKNEFKVDDLVVYIEIDSIVPDGLDPKLQVEYKILKKYLHKATGDAIKETEDKIATILAQNTRPEFEFLRDKKFKIKTRTYKSINVISQGIIFPISILPDGLIPIKGLDVTDDIAVEKIVEDPDEVDDSEQDASDLKGPVEKWFDSHFMRYPAYRKFKISMKGIDKSGKWEDWLPAKSDEEQIQKIYTRMWNTYRDRDGWYYTEKLEGQSFATYNHIVPAFFGFSSKTIFGVCSHNRNLCTEDGSRFWKTAKELDLEKRMNAIKKNIVIRGEHVGPGIQENIYRLKGYNVALFEVWDIADRRLYNYDEFMEFCLKYEFETVPVLGTNCKLLPTVEEMISDSHGYSKYHDAGDVLREGKVWRRMEDSRISFKVRDPIYLALHGK